jgi:oxygen-independent coproporphyrinogen-3 oxidase
LINTTPLAGIYIHIPFCKSRCTYCDFYSCTDLSLREKLLQSICTELINEKSYLENETIDTLYFGGGTPSLLHEADFSAIFAALAIHYNLSNCREITLEANPDDLTEDYLAMLRRFPFNRISIGVQSMRNEELRLINRRHTAEQAIRSVARCRAAGFENISVDLIYGYPSQRIDEFIYSLDNLLKMNVKHISAYHLTYEKDTVLYQQLQRGEICEITEELSVEMYRQLVKKLAEKGFKQYEISNFAQAGYESQHNSSYWNGSKYLGVGPSAHSYNGVSRRWNMSNITAYIESVNGKSEFREIENLSESDRYNDFIITTLRTSKGASLKYLQKNFSETMLDFCLKNADKHLKNKLLKIEKNYLKFTSKGIVLSDTVLADLFLV